MEFETKMKVCMAIIGLGALFILLYAIGKIIGVIHSPIWVDMSPYITVVSTLGAIFVSTGMVLQKIASMSEKVSSLEKESKGHSKEFSRLFERIAVIETKLAR